MSKEIRYITASGSKRTGLPVGTPMIQVDMPDLYSILSPGELFWKTKDANRDTAYGLYMFTHLSTIDPHSRQKVGPWHVKPTINVVVDRLSECQHCSVGHGINDSTAEIFVIINDLVLKCDEFEIDIAGIVNQYISDNDKLLNANAELVTVSNQYPEFNNIKVVVA